MNTETELRIIAKLRGDGDYEKSISWKAAEEINTLRQALIQARRFAELINAWGQPGREIYKHELINSSLLSIERINEALE